MARELVFKIGGLTGEGIDSAGDILALAAARAGAEVHTYRTFSTVIKGGHTTYEVRTAARPVRAPADGVDCLLALDHFSLEQDLDQLRPGGALVYDPSIGGEPGRLPDGARACPLPLLETAKAHGGPIAKNMVGIGAAGRLAGLRAEHIEGAIRARFTGARARHADASAAAARAGWELAAREHAPLEFSLPRAGSAAERRLRGNQAGQADGVPGKGGERAQRLRLSGNQAAQGGAQGSGLGHERLLLSGNEAAGFGALVGGCRFYAGYPITPASELLEYMAARLPEVGGVALQVEDEIAALCMAVGAGHAGTRAMSATSGPGIALMTEAFGMAGATETPVVVLDCQRLGPSVGAPTRHAQQDLKQLALGTAGDFAHVVLTPGSTEELFQDVILAFNLAETYQCPVFVASDHMLAMCKRTVPAFDLASVRIERGELVDGHGDGAQAEGYRRYALTESGIAPRAIPGEGRPTYMVTAGDHDEWGWHDDLGAEAPRIRRAQQERNARKTGTVLERIPGTRYHGPEGAEILLIALGAPTGPILELLDGWSIDGSRVGFLQVRCLWPLPVADIATRVAAARQAVVVEHNLSGQLAMLVRTATPEHHKLGHVRKYDGEPFRAGELRDAVERALVGAEAHP